MPRSQAGADRSPPQRFATPHHLWHMRSFAICLCQASARRLRVEQVRQTYFCHPLKTVDFGRAMPSCWEQTVSISSSSPKVRHTDSRSRRSCSGEDPSCCAEVCSHAPTCRTSSRTTRPVSPPLPWCPGSLCRILECSGVRSNALWMSVPQSRVRRRLTFRSTFPSEACLRRHPNQSTAGTPSFLYSIPWLCHSRRRA